MRKIISIAEASRALSAPETILFNHSTRCPVSAYAFDQVAEFERRRPEASVLLVDVIASRDVSLWLAETTGVGHESPQVIVLKGGVVVFSASHDGVTADALERAASRAS